MKNFFWSRLGRHHVVKKLQGHQHHVLLLVAGAVTALHYSHSGIMHGASISSLMQLCA